METSIPETLIRSNNDFLRESNGGKWPISFIYTGGPFGYLEYISILSAINTQYHTEAVLYFLQDKKELTHPTSLFLLRILESRGLKTIPASFKLDKLNDKPENFINCHTKDLLMWEILSTKGGLVLDTDNLCLKDLISTIPEDKIDKIYFAAPLGSPTKDYCLSPYYSSAVMSRGNSQLSQIGKDLALYTINNIDDIPWGATGPSLITQLSKYYENLPDFYTFPYKVAGGHNGKDYQEVYSNNKTIDPKWHIVHLFRQTPEYKKFLDDLSPAAVEKETLLLHRLIKLAIPEPYWNIKLPPYEEYLNLLEKEKTMKPVKTKIIDTSSSNITEVRKERLPGVYNISSSALDTILHKQEIADTNIKQEIADTNIARKEANILKYFQSQPRISPMRFHYLGMPHLPTRRDISGCAYSQKIVKLCSMLSKRGHKVTFYGNENSDVEAEMVNVFSQKENEEHYGVYDWHKQMFNYKSNTKAHELFNKRAIVEILKRKEEKDKLLLPMGTDNRIVADTVGLQAIESGIGYTGIFAKYKVFESYAWMHYLYGKRGSDKGDWYDCVIPNYWHPSDFTYKSKKQDYFLYIGRLIANKGVRTALDVAKKLGAKILVVGQGSPETDLQINPKDYTNAEFRPAVGPEERAELMANARAVFTPTYYIEPFGGVNVEAQMSGTPVITPDFGVFNETVLHGTTGYRCRTFEHFLWAAKNIDKIKPENCRLWAVANFSCDRVALMYEEFFKQIDNLYKAGWYEIDDDRCQLDWLTKYVPETAEFNRICLNTTKQEY